MQFNSRFARIAGATTLAVLVTMGLTACGNEDVNEDYLVVATVTDIECPEGDDDRQMLIDELQATADFVNGAGNKTTNDILSLNEDLESTEPLIAALNDKIEECAPADTDDENESADDESKEEDSEDGSDADVTDAEKIATVNSEIWGDLDNWEYPEELLDLLNEFEFKTQKVDDQEFPRLINCTSPYDEERISSDAAVAPRGSAREYIALALACPAYGAHLLSGLAQDQTRIIGGKSILELNAEFGYLEEFKDPAVINDWADEALDGSKAEQLIVAKKLAFVYWFLIGIDNEPILEAGTTTLNYHQVVTEVGGVLTINPSNPTGVREFAINPVQYTGKFYKFQLSFKGQTGCWLEVWINEGDGRFALGTSCAPPPPPPPPPPPGCKEPCGGLSGKTGNTPGQETSITPAPTKTTPPAEPEDVDETPFTEVETETDAEDEGGPAPGGPIGDD
jgi:hypothetical protein